MNNLKWVVGLNKQANSAKSANKKIPTAKEVALYKNDKLTDQDKRIIANAGEREAFARINSNFVYRGAKHLATAGIVGWVLNEIQKRSDPTGMRAKRWTSSFAGGMLAMAVTPHLWDNYNATYQKDQRKRTNKEQEEYDEATSTGDKAADNYNILERNRYRTYNSNGGVNYE